MSVLIHLKFLLEYYSTCIIKFQLYTYSAQRECIYILYYYKRNCGKIYEHCQIKLDIAVEHSTLCQVL